jgi:hypothetical protein
MDKEKLMNVDKTILIKIIEIQASMIRTYHDLLFG